MRCRKWLYVVLVLGASVLALGISVCTLLLLGAPSVEVRADPGVLYVKPVASGSGDCSSWTDACTLQAALGAAVSGHEIWVAAGIHKPGSNRTDTFTLKSGVAVYGGFDGEELERDERDWTTNVTILSGDIDNNDITDANGVITDTANIVGTNSYHVVYNSGAKATAILDGFTITGGDSDNFGGGMYNDASSPTLTNVTFSGNRALSSGGGMDNNNSSPHLTDCEFRGNTAEEWDGGGMRNWDSSPVLTRTHFFSNTANQGGGMYSRDNSSPKLTECDFSDNNAAARGGGMINNSSSPTLTNVTFSGNRAGAASGLGEGGGMYNVRNSSPKLVNCRFTGNSALTVGGGMYNDLSSSATLTDCTFTGNIAEYVDGGGMYNRDSSATLTRCEFSDNTAARGGGMYNAASSATLENVTFSGNRALSSGGGMYNTGSSPELTNVTFSDNTAEVWDGGGMYNYASSPTLANVTFSGNRALSSGGGMDNNNSSPHLTDCEFRGNTAEVRDGGGMANWDSSPVLTRTHFFTNTATLGGGGMYNEADSSPGLYDCQFISNSADHGGGMYNLDSTPALTGAGFLTNSADLGGGMYNDSGSPNLSYFEFRGNKADRHGGAIYNSGSHPTLAVGTLIGNKADADSNSEGNGGGMYNDAASSPVLINVTLSGNWAQYGGGMANVGGSVAQLKNTIVWGNTAPGGWPQIHDDGGSVDGSNCMVEGGYQPCLVEDTASPFVDADGVDNVPGTADDDVRLVGTSNAIDAGDNSHLPNDVEDVDDDGDTTEKLPHDLAGDPRCYADPNLDGEVDGDPDNQTDDPEPCEINDVDLGAYEAGCPPWQMRHGYQWLEQGQKYRLGFHADLVSSATPTMTLGYTLDQWAAEVSAGQLSKAQTTFEIALGCAATVTETQQAVAGIHNAIWELATGAMLEGNELLVQALDVTNASESPEAEIALLENAVELYSQAIDGYLEPLAGEHQADFLAALRISRTHPISDSGTFVETYVDLERLATASAKKSRAILELAELQFRRYTLQSKAQAEAALREGLNEATVELVLLYSLRPEVVEDVNYTAVLRNMEDMDRLYRYLQQGKNPFGYGPEYVPFAYHHAVKDESNYVQAKYIADDKYESAEKIVAEAQGKQKEIDDNYSELQSRLNDIRTLYDAQLVDLCGSTDVTRCDGGAIGDKLYDIQRALLGVERVLQQMEDQNALIRIEQERVAKVAGIERATAQLIADSGEKLADLAAQEARLQSSGSTTQGIFGVLGSVFSGATSMGGAGGPWGAIAGGIIGGALEAGNWASEPDVAEDLADVNAAKERLYARQKAAVHYAQGDIAEADSLALQKKLFLQFAQLEIDHAIALNNLMQEVARLQNLTTQVQYAIAEREKAQNFTSLLFRDPAGRVLRDRYMELAHYRYGVALESAYKAGRALEYELNQEVTFEGLPLNHVEDLYPLQDTVFLYGALAQMDDEYDDWLGQYRPQERTDTVYLSRLVGFEDSYDPDLERVVYREEKFNAFVRDPANRVDRDNDGFEELEFTFQTSIYPHPGEADPFPPLQLFNNKILWINMRVRGQDLSVDGRELTQVDVSLRQDGVSLMRTENSRVHLGGEDDIRSYNLDPKTAFIQAAINDHSFPQDNKELFSRSVANTRWTIRIAGHAQNLNLDNVDEIELVFHCEAFTLQGGAQAARQSPDLAPPSQSRPYRPMRHRLAPMSLKGSAPDIANLSLTTQISATDLNGTYVGWAVIDEPPYMPPVSLVAVLTETNGVLSGYLTPTLECPTGPALAGSWSGEAFELRSEPFTMTMTTGVPITRQVFFHTGVISEAGKILTGVYSETLAGLTHEPMERVGEFRLERRARQLVAGFTASPVYGSVPLRVEFEDLSLGDPTHWAWDFGDGGTSDEQHPSHVYYQVGTYTITLTVSNTFGITTTIEPNYISVTEPTAPVAYFSASPRSGFVPLRVAFEDRSAGGPTSWAWDFGDGTESTKQHPIHTYDQTGSYTVTLTVSSTLGYDTRTVPDYVTVMERESAIYLPIILKSYP